MRDVLVFILKIPVRVYRYVISPLFPPTCRFSPTCSDYCLQALEKHGALAGVWLTFKRIMRCQPWSAKHGFDPVPACIKCDHDECDHVTHKKS